MDGNSHGSPGDNGGRDLDLLIVVFLLFLICIVFTLFHTRSRAVQSIFTDPAPATQANATIG